ncbi:hypothetical protein [Mucilaginibacter panaciglaebae]|uniref:Uncharacterized protein n=1 Tax=Mucilaginibacter panaciglaebae TaxID=502331 RepID=A0ABP7X4Y6_9SPHI
MFSSVIGSTAAGSFAGKLAGNVLSSAIVSGGSNALSGQNVFKGLESGAINGVISTGLGEVEFGGSWAGVGEDTAFGGVSGGIVSKAFGGKFGDGFTNGALSALFKNIAYYRATIDAKQQGAEDYLDDDFSTHPTDDEILHGVGSTGDLQYDLLTAEQYNYIKDNYGGSTGNNVFDLLEGSDIPEIGDGHFKVGNLHFRNYTGQEYGKIQPGYSVHYDNYNVNLNPFKHYIIDTMDQAARGYK